MLSRTTTILLLAALMLPLSALADTGQTDWSLLPSGGTYSWDGNTNDGLVGSGIGVGSVGGVGTGLNAGDTLDILYGQLNFTSGQYNGNGSNWSWGAGGTLTITGCIAGVSSADCSASHPETLVDDDFSSVSIVPVVQLGQYGFDVVFGALSGSISADVASFFGISQTFNATSLNLIATKGTPGQKFAGVNIGGQLKASATLAASEDWGLASMLAFFAFAAVAFGIAWRMGFVKPVVF